MTKHKKYFTTKIRQHIYKQIASFCLMKNTEPLRKDRNCCFFSSFSNMTHGVFLFLCFVSLNRRQCFFPLPLLSHAGDGAMCLVYKSTDTTGGSLKQSHLSCSLDPLSATQEIVVSSFTWNIPQEKCPQFVFYRWHCGSLLLSLRGEKLNEGQRRAHGPIPPVTRSLSLHRVLMRWGVPVWVAGHVAVGRHVHSLGRRGHVPYGRDGRRARGQSDGTRQRVTLVGITALLQQLLELRPFVLEPDFYLKYISIDVHSL